MKISISTANIAIAVAGFAICALGLVQTIVGRSMERGTRKTFIAFFIVLLAYVGCDLVGQLTEGLPGATAGFVTRTALFLESAFSSLLTLMLTGFLLYNSGERAFRRTALFRAVAALWLAYIALLVYTQFSASIYYYDAQNVYHRGPLYPVLLIPPVLIMVLNLAALFRRRAGLSEKQRAAFAVYLIVPMASMLVQMLFFGLYVIVLGTAVSALFMFIYIQNDQIERYLLQEEENTQLRIDMMLSQIQPHFLYNSLGAIGHLCRNDPEAKAAVNRFSRYLRHNMESLSQTKPIPFERELEHTKAYLELEQLRFPNELNVAFDLQCTDFLLPTLTLQPLTENAVRHGIRGSATGTGTVTISTRETENGYEITVADDGAGFDPNGETADDGRRHIGLNNVRERLRRVSGGELRIVSAPGQGCRATIILPKENAYADIRA